MEKENCEGHKSWVEENSFMVLVLFILLAVIIGAVFIY